MRYDNSGGPTLNPKISECQALPRSVVLVQIVVRVGWNVKDYISVYSSIRWDLLSITKNVGDSSKKSSYL